jgi:membrane protease subunit HflK
MIRARILLLIAVVAAAALLVASGLCSVAPSEAVVVRRLGRVLVPAWGPGLHWRWPLGIDRIDRVRALEVRQLTIGLRGPAPSDFEPAAGELVSGDLNMVLTQATIQYRVADPSDYVLRAEQREPLLYRLAEAALTRAIASRSVDGVLRCERQAVAQDAERVLRSRVEALHLGVAILGVNLTDARPPVEVEAEFAAAQSAESQRDRRINEAKSYAETTATTALSQAHAIGEAASADAKRRTLTATAQAEAFQVLLAEAQRAPSVTIRRIYIESLQTLLDRVKSKIVLPPGDSVDVTVVGSQDAPAPGPSQ